METIGCGCDIDTGVGFPYGRETNKIPHEVKYWGKRENVCHTRLIIIFDLRIYLEIVINDEIKTTDQHKSVYSEYDKSDSKESHNFTLK